jgi:hypothetical protein
MSRLVDDILMLARRDRGIAPQFEALSARVGKTMQRKRTRRVA